MKEIQLLHKGKVYHGRIGYDQSDMIEVQTVAPIDFTCGDKVLCFDFQRRQLTRVLHVSNNKVILAPKDSEIFDIGTRPEHGYDDCFGDEQVTIKSFKLNTFATLNDDFKITAVRISDISQMGIGIEVNDFSIKLNHVYDMKIFCDDECISPQVIVRYAHIMEKTIRYGAEMHKISTSDLNKLRYHIATQQFKQLMHA
ncbi:PilZ domain-containing protein [Paenibacillus agricola]|uniref:PilZ domain-containing protein n=1 Tax=Paenibacillus agricola TaxID=2716264 RepID=A0ABX0J0Y5_9BACL|nr:PilZ domain-containing protein [Paenibacillus agricola]NHN29101.1 PilZ domain-containing protein [Paenibacillus agricola]